jgi:hypothetical protein
VPTPVPDDGDIYSAYIKTLLDHEQDRKSSLEAKASTVVTTSGVLVTLLFGLAAVVTGTAKFKIPNDSRAGLIAAAILFVLACGFAIATATIPVPYGKATFGVDKIQESWKHPAYAARRNVARAQLQLIPIAVKRNDLKVMLVRAAAISELLALAVLAIAIVLILI